MHTQSKIYFALGTMSGTSMDGIDVALIKTDGQFAIELIDTASYRYQLAERFYLKAAEFAIRQEAKNKPKNRDQLLMATSQNFIKYFQQFCEQTQQTFPSKTWKEIIALSTTLHAELLNKLIHQHAEECRDAIIGYHGQTLYHQPQYKITIQIGDPKQLSTLTGLPVVYDFRQLDMDQGGQGAPLAPVFHQALVIRDRLPLPCAVINCGGIANISLIKGKEMNDMVGFDIGPGNVLLDNFVRLKTNFKEHFDLDGQYASQGKVWLEWVQKLKEEACCIKNYYDLPSPKALDTADFHFPAGFDTLSLEDGCATLAFFTAERIADALLKQEKAWRPQFIILVGGGWHNPVITQHIHQLLPQAIQIKTANDLHWDNETTEAQIFAYLAVRHIKQMPYSFPLTTGVAKPVCGGIYTYSDLGSTT